MKQMSCYIFCRSGWLGAGLAFLIVIIFCSPVFGAPLTGLSPGMGESEVLRALRRQSGDEKAGFLDSICSIPLGLGFHQGARFFTRDTGIVMKKAQGYEPLYFLDGRLFGVRRDGAGRDGFNDVKKRFPGGRVYSHRFPNNRRAVKVFEYETDKYYIFSGLHGNLFILDNPARKRVMAGIRGSFCWHSKLFSPNLPRHAEHYLKCLRLNPEIGPESVMQDLERCSAYCAETPAIFASRQCPTICRQTHLSAMDLVKYRERYDQAEPEPEMERPGQAPAPYDPTAGDRIAGDEPNAYRGAVNLAAKPANKPAPLQPVPVLPQKVAPEPAPPQKGRTVPVVQERTAPDPAGPRKAEPAPAAPPRAPLSDAAPPARLERPAPPAVPAGPRTMNSILCGLTREGPLVQLLADGPIGRSMTLSLPDPPRVVIDIDGGWVYNGPLEIPFQSANTERLRIGVYQDKLRLVIDLKSEGPSPFIQKTENGMVIMLQ